MQEPLVKGYARRRAMPCCVDGRRRATNEDGRCSDLLDPTKRLDPGLYKMVFHTAAYLEKVTGQPAFYPYVEVRPETRRISCRLTLS